MFVSSDRLLLELKSFLFVDLIVIHLKWRSAGFYFRLLNIMLWVGRKCRGGEREGIWLLDLGVHLVAGELGYSSNLKK